MREFLESGAAASEGNGGAGEVRIAAVGKAAVAMARGALAAWPGRIAGGVVLAPEADAADRLLALEVHTGGHPVPDASGVAGAAAIHRMAGSLGEEDTLLCLISGGGSALMTLPADGLDLSDLQRTTDLLLKSGASIDELNTVRKQLDRLKGGRLAATAAPARVATLILSDVVGDPPEVIASGPTVPDRSTFAEAVAVLRGRELWTEIPTAVRERLERGLSGRAEESPKPGAACFDRARHWIVGSNRLAAEAALATAAGLGYDGRLLTTELVGEARDAGRLLASEALEARAAAPRSASCRVAAGETTVTVRGAGKGGRNQELALAAGLALDGVPGVLVGSVGTDGVDGPTDAAGATADGTTVARARDLGLQPKQALADNDSYPLFAALGDLVVTGPTGTNVMDVQIVLAADRGSS